MTAEVFKSVRTNPDDAFEIQNVLSIRLSTHVVNDQAIALVNVDTNYKDTRPGEHPVLLSLVDAVKAAAALVEVASKAYGRMSEDNPHLAWELLNALSLVDGETGDLRGSLLPDIKPEED